MGGYYAPKRHDRKTLDFLGHGGTLTPVVRQDAWARVGGRHVRRSLVVVALVVALTAGAGGCAPAGSGGGEARLLLPEGWPADVPVLERSQLRAARGVGSDGIMLVFETEEPAGTVQGRLRDRLAAGGWELISEAAIENAVFTSYGKAGRSLALSFSGAGGVTVVGMTYHAPPRGGNQG